MDGWNWNTIVSFGMAYSSGGILAISGKVALPKTKMTGWKINHE